ncbi:ABC transporter substrate-binding protein [Gracilinema caldarium]|nr:extracellular solute-binding protein [Gracilinema caldarium]
MNKRQITLISYLIIMIMSLFIFYFLFFIEQHDITLGVFTGSAWNVPNPTAYRLYDGLIADFRALYPEYNVSYKSGILARDYSEVISENILLSEEPDLFFILPEDFTTFASLGVLANLDDYIINGSLDVSKLYENALDAGKYNNHQYALPFEVVPSLMFVNVTLLHELKLSMPKNNWTWSDLMYYAIHATKDTDTNGVLDTFGVNGWTWLDAAYSNYELLFDSMGTMALLDQDGVIEAVDFYLKLKSLTRNSIVPDFDSGRVLFSPFPYSSYRAYKYYPYSIQRFGNFKWKALNMPKGPNGQNASELRVLLIGVAKKSKDKKGVMDLLYHLTLNSESAFRILAYSQGLPAQKDIITSKRAEEILAHHIAASETPIDANLLDELIRDSIVVPRFKKHASALEIATRAINSEQVQSTSSLKNFLSKLDHSLESYIKE